MLSCLKKMRVHGESLIPVTPVYSFYICTAALPSLMCSLAGAAMSSNINSINKIFKCVQLSRDCSSRFLDIQSCTWNRESNCCQGSKYLKKSRNVSCFRCLHYHRIYKPVIMLIKYCTCHQVFSSGVFE